jgi:REP element-mobilizing transposase RayT
MGAISSRARARFTLRECTVSVSKIVGQHFWARGYMVSTVGRDETVIREYIRNQEQEDKRLDQLNLWK